MVTSQATLPVAQPTVDGLTARIDGTDLLLPADIVDQTLMRALHGLNAIELESANSPAVEAPGYVRTHPTVSPYVVVALAEHLLPHHHNRLPVQVALRLEIAQHRYQTAIDASSAVTPPPGYSPDIPPQLLQALRPYQLAALHYLETYADWKAVLGDDAGLGKSIMALSAAFRENGAHLPALIICKATLITNWEDEIAKWVPGTTVEAIRGQKTWSDRDQPIPPADAYLINYELLHHRIDDLIKIAPKAVIIDESQMLMSYGVNPHAAEEYLAGDRNKKPPGAWRTWAANKLTETVKPTTILELSATPSPNGRHRELDPQLAILNRLAELGGTEGFTRRYARVCDTCFDEHTKTYAPACNHHTYAEKYRRPNTDGSINAAELNRRLRSRTMVRRSTLQVMGDLDPITTVELRLPLKPKDRREYEKVEQEFLDWLKAHAATKARRDGESVGQAVARAVRAAQGDHEHLMRLSYLKQAAAKAKLDPALKYIADATEGHDVDGRPRKAIVFAWHREVQAQLLEALPNAPRILAATDMTGEEIRESKRRFQEDMDDPDARVIVLSLAAAAEGHTLTAAQTVIFHDLGNAQGAALRQACGRAAFRVSDPHSIVATHLIAQNTIDEMTFAAINAKRALMAQVMDDGRTLEWGAHEVQDRSDTDVAAETLQSWIDARL